MAPLDSEVPSPGESMEFRPHRGQGSLTRSRWPTAAFLKHVSIRPVGPISRGPASDRLVERLLAADGSIVCAKSASPAGVLESGRQTIPFPQVSEMLLC